MSHRYQNAGCEPPLEELLADPTGGSAAMSELIPYGAQGHLRVLAC